MALSTIPSMIVTTLKFRSGVIGSLRDPYFKKYRQGLLATTFLLGASFWGSLISSGVVFFFSFVLTFITVYPVRLWFFTILQELLYLYLWSQIYDSVFRFTQVTRPFILTFLSLLIGEKHALPTFIFKLFLLTFYLTRHMFSFSRCICNLDCEDCFVHVPEQVSFTNTFQSKLLLKRLVPCALTITLNVLIDVFCRYNFVGFYRKRPLVANISSLCFECWHLALTSSYIILRVVKLFIIIIVYVGRFDTPVLAQGVGEIGPIKLDAFPFIFKQDLLAIDAHRHPYIERLGMMVSIDLSTYNFMFLLNV